MCDQKNNRGKKMHHSLLCQRQQGITCKTEGIWRANSWFESTFWGYSNNEGKETLFSGYEHINNKRKENLYRHERKYWGSYRKVCRGNQREVIFTSTTLYFYSECQIWETWWNQKRKENWDKHKRTSWGSYRQVLRINQRDIIFTITT